MNLSGGRPLGADVSGDELNISSQAAGTFLYYNGSTWVILPPGTAGEKLTTEATGTPTWAAGFEEIADTTLASAAALITISGIPSGYPKLLLLFMNAYANAVNGYALVRFNADSAGNYTRHYIRATGGAVSAASGTGESSTWLIQQIGNAAAEAGASLLWIDNIAGSIKVTHGTWMGHTSAAAEYGGTQGGVWTNTTDAISTIDILSGAGSFETGTRAILLGLRT